jgi:hypothetical protein
MTTTPDQHKVAQALIKGQDIKELVDSLKRAGVKDADGTMASTIQRLINATTIPRQLQAGYCLELMRHLIDLSQSAGELAVARGAIKDYWAMVKDICPE